MCLCVSVEVLGIPGGSWGVPGGYLAALGAALGGAWRVYEGHLQLRGADPSPTDRSERGDNLGPILWRVDPCFGEAQRMLSKRALGCRRAVPQLFSS